MNIKVENYFSKMTEFVKYIYITHIILSFCVFTTETWLTSITPILVVVLSAIILVYRLINMKKYMSYPLILLYVLFVLLYVVSSLLNISYGLIGNVKIIIWMTIQIGVLYLCDIEKAKVDIKKELENCLFLVIFLTSIMNLVGLGMLFTNYYSFREVNDEVTHIMGITYWGRLFGIHTDPNYGAVQTYVAIVAAVYLWIKQNKRWKKGLLVLFTIINILHLSFSGSRTGLVALAVGGAIFASIYSFQKNSKPIKSLIFAVLVVVMVFGGNSLINNGYNQISVIIAEIRDDKDGINDEHDFVEIGREEEIAEDISNRRFDLWQNAIEISQTSPLLGVSFANVVDYCRHNLPNSYLLTNGYSIFDAFHNMFMDLLVGQGVIGFIVFMLIIVLSLRYLLINLKNIPNEDKLDCCFLFSVATGILCSSLFVSQILYAHTPGTILFWLLWGYLICLFKINKTT